MKFLLFYFFAGLSLLSALAVVTVPKPTRALLALLGTMFSLAVLYLLAGAPFVAMAQLVVYAGAVLVLFLFVIMLQGIGAKDIPFKERFRARYFALVFFVLAGFLTCLALLFSRAFIFPVPRGIHGTVESFAGELFRNYLLPFELVSLLLLLGVFAAVSLAKKEPGE